MSVPLIDAEALREFMDKAMPLLPPVYLQGVARVLERRSDDALRVNFEGDAVWSTPATRRLPEAERSHWQDSAETIWPLILEGDAQGVLDRTEGTAPEWLRDWATFWMHARDPETYPWWARWVYRPIDRTGALLLVLDDPDALAGLGDVTCYSRMRESELFLGEVLQSTRRLPGIPAPHVPTVALAAIYGVYMFTMASWRMTSEFTQALPPFPNVVRTLLGINRWEWNRIGTEGQTG